MTLGFERPQQPLKPLGSSKYGENSRILPILWAVHSRNCEGILILNGTSFLQIWTAPKVPKAKYECNKSIEDDGSFLCLRFASQMRSERRHHGPTEAVDFIPKSDFPATLPVKISELDGAKLRGFTAKNTNWIGGVC